MPKRLLIADDSITIQKMVSLTFATEDVVIEAVTNGDHAIEKARSLKPDIVLADIFMPGRSGYEVCEAIKGDPQLSQTPVVLLVGTFEPFDEAEATRVRCNGYLKKPFDSSELLDAFHSLVPQGKSKPTLGGSMSDSPEERGPSQRQPSQKAKLASQRTVESFIGSDKILDLFLPQPTTDLPTRATRHVQVSSPGVAEKGASQVITFPSASDTASFPVPAEISDELIDVIVDRVVRRMSQEVVREVAWEVVPELAEVMIRQHLNERNIPRKS